MKKFLAIILTFAVITSSLSLTACLTVATPSSHSFSNEWSYDDSHHWKVCDDEGCDEISEKASHSFTDGICECGAEESFSGGSGNGGSGSGSGNGGSGNESGNGGGSGITGGGSQQTGSPQVSSTSWQKAFAFDNVTIRQYIVKEGKHEYISSYLFDGDKLMLSAPGHESITEDKQNIERTKSLYDFSSCYSSASYKDGKYFIKSFSPLDGITHEDVYLTFSDGKIVLIEGTLAEGSGYEEAQDYYTEFINYGTTAVVKPNQNPATPNKPGISVTDPNLDDVGGNQSSKDPTHPDLDHTSPEPEQDRVYLDDEERVYHRKLNCVNKKLVPSDKSVAEKKNYKACSDCFK